MHVRLHELTREVTIDLSSHVEVRRMVVPPHFPRAMTGMPRLVMYRAIDGEMILYEGVTRLTRVGKLLAGQTVSVEVIGSLSSTGARLPTVEERLP